jgi:hypothetical protein
VATRPRFTPQVVRRAIYQARNPVRVRQPFPLPQILNQQPYVRPRITGMVVGDEPIPSQRPSFGGPGGIMPPAGAPPATTPPVPSAPSAPVGAAGSPSWTGNAVPGRGGILSWNPQLILPDTALAQGGAADSQYFSDKADAIDEFNQRYHSTLMKLGFMDDQGHYQAGSLDTDYATGHELGLKALQQEGRESTDRARESGILFSGLRARNLLEDQAPFVRDLADLDTTLASNKAMGGSDVEGSYAALNKALRQAALNAWFRKTGNYDFSYNPPS